MMLISVIRTTTPGRCMPWTTLRNLSSVSKETQVLLEDSPDAHTGISILTLNRPKANAMGMQFVSELSHHVNALQENQDCRCLILRSFSDRVFSAGADLKERASMSLDEAERFVTQLRATFQDVAELPMPTIASIEGMAVGGGLELALACDLRVASSTASMGLVETSLAILPGAGGTQRLSRIVGISRAKEIIFTAQKVSGTEAHVLGLVNHVTPPGHVMDKAMELASQIARNGPIGVRAAKHAMDEGLEQSTLRQALEVERAHYRTVLPTDDRLEGLAAFREKRAPAYKGR